MSNDIKFGNCWLELDRLLNESRIKARKGDKIVLNQKCPLDLLDLILRRKTVVPSLLSQRTKETYRKLHHISGKGYDELDRQIILIDNPKDALNRLELLIGSQKAGNNTKKIRNDIVLLKEYLVKHKVMTKEEADQL